MYLLVFTFLVIGFLNIYTQVLAVETTRIYESQTGIGQTMVTWHEAAVSLAGNVVNPFPAGLGCSLTPGVAGGCPVGPHVTITPAGVTTAMVAPPATVTYTYPAVGLPGATNYPNLPLGYDTATYTWNSLAFNTGGGDYVVTYASIPAANGFISTATTQLGITDSDLYQQVRLAGVPVTNLGYVSLVGGNHMIVTPALLPSGAALEYIVPTAVPLNAFAVISGSGACNGC